MKYWNKIKGQLLILAMIICLCCPSVAAKGRTLVDVNQEAEITIDYSVKNAEFSLYKIADVTKEYGFQVTDPFASYKIDFNGLNTDQWKDMAETLTGYVQSDGITPMAVGMTNEDGKLTFEDLSVGIYLVIGSQAREEEFIYRCKPFLAFVPQETEEGEWDYKPVSVPKLSGDPVEIIDISVVKIWKDDGLEEQRPAEIIIQLLKNGEIFEEVVLNEENNWQHSWLDLSSEDDWKIIEKDVPEGYTVQITREGNTFQVTNTGQGTPEVPDKLPQTGQMWWPVPMLTVAGLLLFIVGWVRRRTNDMN